MIRKGCIYHLVRVTDTTTEVPTLESLPIVNEFPGVFSDELPGIPPDREINFGIDMIPGTQPISVPPYRMAPAELKELKEQLKDLLEKGFIRLSVSPWDASVLFVKKKMGKANVVADALSRKSMGSLAHLEADQRPLAREVHRYASLGVRLVDSSEGGVIVRNRAESSLVAEIKEKQYNDPVLGRLYVPNLDGLRERIMAEAHTSRLAFYPQTDGQAVRTIQTLEDMLRACVLDLKGSWDDHLPLIEFSYNNSLHASIQMASFEALYGRRCRSPIGWLEVGEAELIGPYHVHQAMKKVKIIKELLKTAQSRQKSYSDIHRRDLEFKEDDWVFLKVSPMKGIIRFGEKGKLSPRYVRPYRIIQKIGQVAYKLELPPEMSQVHPVFHVSMLKKVVGDPSAIVSVETLEQVEEATWEAENEMKEKYPYLFE
ncbi:uncharacterized protein [Nicotiana sylvestris]|uniref:uncharacterized protein n=1 Tax=Nicotiana sylvestris TaxID=4096 RepID=UPI00388CDB98